MDVDDIECRSVGRKRGVSDTLARSEGCSAPYMVTFNAALSSDMGCWADARERLDYLQGLTDGQEGTEEEQASFRPSARPRPGSLSRRVRHTHVYE